jgi:hypothetical protein
MALPLSDQLVLCSTLRHFSISPCRDREQLPFALPGCRSVNRLGNDVGSCCGFGTFSVWSRPFPVHLSLRPNLCL